MRHILLTGYATDMCFCKTTAGYENLSKDFNVFLVGDATLATFPANKTARYATNAAVYLQMVYDGRENQAAHSSQSFCGGRFPYDQPLPWKGGRAGRVGICPGVSCFASTIEASAIILPAVGIRLL